MNINTRDLGFVNYNGQEMNFVNFNGVTIYEAWKKLIASGIPPLTLLKCKQSNLIDYKVYGNSKQDGTPTPDNPIEIESVGDKTVNLFDVSQNRVTAKGDGSWLNSNTPVAFNGAAMSSKWESVTLNTGNNITAACYGFLLRGNSGDTYTISNVSGIAGTRRYIGFINVQDNNFTTIGDINTYTFPYTFTIPEGANGVLIEWTLNDTDLTMSKGIQIQEGTSTTEYEPYGYKIPVKASGVNLHNHNLFGYKETTTNGITFTPLEDGTFRVKGKLTNTGITTSYRVVKTTAIPIKAGTYRSKPQKSSSIGVMFGVYKKTTNTPFWLNINSTSNSGITTLSEDAYVGYCQIFVRAGTTGEIDEIVYPQLTKGTIDYPYQPYVEPVTSNIYLKEPLRKIGDYADYIDFEKGKVLRNIKNLIFNGSEDWKNYGNRTNMYYIRLEDCMLGYQMSKCNRFENKNGIWDNTNAIGVYTDHTSMQYKYFATPNESINDVTSFKEWLSSNNTDFYYVLATPTEEIIELPNIPTNKGTNIIEIDTTITPSNMEVTYLGKK